jgi:hypothetical protein
VAAKDSQTFMRGRVVVGFAVHAVAPLMSIQRVRKTGREEVTRGEEGKERRDRNEDRDRDGANLGNPLI